MTQHLDPRRGEPNVSPTNCRTRHFIQFSQPHLKLVHTFGASSIQLLERRTAATYADVVRAAGPGYARQYHSHPSIARINRVAIFAVKWRLLQWLYAVGRHRWVAIQKRRVSLFGEGIVRASQHQPLSGNQFHDAVQRLRSAVNVEPNFRSVISCKPIDVDVLRVIDDTVDHKTEP